MANPVSTDQALEPSAEELFPGDTCFGAAYRLVVEDPAAELSYAPLWPNCDEEYIPEECVWPQS